VNINNVKAQQHKCQTRIQHKYQKNEIRNKKNITSSVYDCTVEDVEHVVIALTGAHMQPACV